MKHFFLAFSYFLLVFLWGCERQVVSHSQGSMTDSRDGAVYKTAIVGSQEWLAENLRFKADSSWCYKDNERLCDSIGRFYQWDVATAVCPEGWRLPSKEDVEKLYVSLGGNSVAGLKMKSGSGWMENGNGSDEFGLGFLPVGFRHYDGSFQGDSSSAYYWTSTEKYDRESVIWGASYLKNAGDVHHDYKEQGYPVRCLREHSVKSTAE